MKVYPGMIPTNQAFIADADDQVMLENCLYREGFNILKLMHMNTKKLESFGKWLATALIPIGKLTIHSSCECDITCEALQHFETCLKKSKVFKINYLISSIDDSVSYLAEQIETRYNSKNKGV